MRDPEADTTRRSKQASGTRSAGDEVGLDLIGQVEMIKTIDESWLERLGDWLRPFADGFAEGFAHMFDDD